MNRFAILLTVAVFCGGLIVGLYFLLRPSEPSILPQTNQQPSSSQVSSTVTVPADRSEAAVQQAYRNELAKQESDNTKLFETVIAGEYALQVYAGDIFGGQALLKYDPKQGKWVLVDGGGGRWSVGVLVEAGVPADVAEELLGKLQQ